MRPTAADELARDSEIQILQKRWLLIRRLRVQGGRTYLEKSAAGFGIGTQGGAIHSDCAEQVSSGIVLP
jgi:hypothetical protein